jgi:hypothetical protein
LINISLSNDLGTGWDVFATANISFESLYNPTVEINVLGSVSKLDSANEPSEPVTNVGLFEQTNDV